MRVLGIETSCDETSAAVVDGTDARATLESLVILSQDVHKIFGGVVPEIASREHLTGIVPVVRRALADANVSMRDIDAIAVTNAPGLVGALLVGVSFAKSLAFATGKPLIGVHHMEGHLFAASLEIENAVPPFTALLVSGGHTMIVDVPRWGSYQVLGKTRDDAAGEAFDVSFSGLKTAVLNSVREAERAGPLDDAARGGLAKGFQDALIATLVGKTARAVAAFGRQRVVIAGGVAANRALGDALRERLGPSGVEVIAPSSRLSTDNAAMIARAGLHHLERGERSGIDLTAFATQSLPGVVPA